MSTNRIQPQDREGWKRPAETDDQPHPVWIDAERHRVICRECCWYAVKLGASKAQLRAFGQRHRRDMKHEAAA